MKALFTIGLAMLLAGCGDPEAEGQAAGEKFIGAVEVTRERQEMAAAEDRRSRERSITQMKTLAGRYLFAVQGESLAEAMEASARDELGAQRTTGGAALKEIEYREKKEALLEKRSQSEHARMELVDVERRSGMMWEAAKYSEAIDRYKFELNQKLREYHLARHPESLSRLHQEWLDFSKVTLEQIETGDY